MASDGQPPPDAPSPERASSDDDERIGPLVLQRVVKEDGRALILFSRVVDTAEPGGGEA